MKSQVDHQVLIIGAGPAGLATAKCLNDLQINYQLVDREGEVGGSYLRMYSHMQLSSPPSYLGLPGASPLHGRGYLKVSDYVPYLKQYAIENRIMPIRREVIRIQRGQTGFDITFGDSIKTNSYAFIVACTGSFDKPNMPIVPGLNDVSINGEDRVSFSHACHWKGTVALNTNRILIVGGGMTAIELAEECVQNGIKPIMSFKAGRGRTFPSQILGLNPRFIIYPLMLRAPLRLFQRQCTEGWQYRGINRGFKKYCEQHLIDLRPRIQTIQGRAVTFTDGTSAEIDHIVFATGYRWDMPFLPDIIPKGLQGNPILKHGEIATWPGFFCVGITCSFSASSHFIYGIAEDARSVAEAIFMRMSED